VVKVANATIIAVFADVNFMIHLHLPLWLTINDMMHL